MLAYEPITWRTGPVSVRFVHKQSVVLTYFCPNVPESACGTAHQLEGFACHNGALKFGSPELSGNLAKSIGQCTSLAYGYHRVQLQIGSRQQPQSTQYFLFRNMPHSLL
jgi:hypothetical protein